MKHLMLGFFALTISQLSFAHFECVSEDKTASLDIIHQESKFSTVIFKTSGKAEVLQGYYWVELKDGQASGYENYHYTLQSDAGKTHELTVNITTGLSSTRAQTPWKKTAATLEMGNTNLKFICK